MKTTSLFTVFFLFIFSFANAQTASNNRVSPLDTIQTQIEDLKVEITYSRPFLKGREFGKDIVPYGKVWRTGANEATVFEVNQDVLIEGKLLPAGKYSLYTIPDEKETIVIFNKEWNQWGTQYDESKDVLRVIIPTFNAPEPVEQFTIDLDEAGAACMVWGDKLFTFHLNRA